MPTQVWMIGTDRGCPLSYTLRLGNPGNPELYTNKYVFMRNGSAPVEDEHVEQILATEIQDVQGNPQRYFTTTPPTEDLDDSDRLRMVVESQQNRMDAQDERFNTLTGLLGEALGISASDLAEKLGMGKEEEETDFLEGMDSSGTGE